MNVQLAPSPRRSFLFVPGDSARKMEKARSLPADVIILDLEDAVAPGAKVTAREMVAAALAQGDFGRSEVLVRLNGPATDDFSADLRVVVTAGAAGLVLPKVDTAASLTQVEARLDEMAPERPLPLFVFIESARALLAVAAIAGHGGRLAGLLLGAEDLAIDLGARRTLGGAEIAYARGAVVAAAAAHRRLAVDTPFLEFQDDDGLRAEARLARDLGFGGKLAIHPRQVPLINAAFAPTAAETEWAERVVTAAADRPEAGTFALDGQMVDRPVVVAAQRALARARQCQEWDHDA